MKRSKRASSKQGKAVPSGSGHEKDGSKSRGKLALSGKVVYLDVKDLRQAHSIQTKLKKLGAVIETFLSKGVNYVISSSAPPRSSSQTRGQGQGEGLGPESPSFAGSPSPFSTTPSPTYKNVDGKIVPTQIGGGMRCFARALQHPGTSTHADRYPTVTRGQAMAQIARARNRSPSPSSAVASAEKLGIKIVAVEAAEKWLDKELHKLGHAVEEATADSQSSPKRKRSGFVKCRRLQHPYIKVESAHHHYRPHYMELPAWPHINVDTPAATCPFDGKGVTTIRRSGRGDRDGLASVEHFFSPGSHSTTLRRSVEGDDSSRLVGLPILTAGDLRRQREKRKKEIRRRGYCECCAIKYDDIDKHVREASHREFARDKQNYDSLDELISGCPSTGDFLRNTLLQHCTQQAASKPSASTQMAEEDDSSNDQVVTLDPNTPRKTRQPHAPGTGFPDPLATLPERVGYLTPTRTPVRPMAGRAPRSPAGGRQHCVEAAGTQENCIDANTAGVGQQEHADAAEGNYRDASGKDPSAGAPTPLFAVVIRRPGAKSAYGSPLRKRGQGLGFSPSPSRRDSSTEHTPKKFRERSMIFGDCPIGSLQPVPEESRPVAGVTSCSCRPNARLGRDCAFAGLKDESEQWQTMGRGSRRQRDVSGDRCQPLTLRRSVKNLSRELGPQGACRGEVNTLSASGSPRKQRAGGTVPCSPADRTSLENIRRKIHPSELCGVGLIAVSGASRPGDSSRTATTVSQEAREVGEKVEVKKEPPRFKTQNQKDHKEGPGGRVSSLQTESIVNRRKKMKEDQICMTKPESEILSNTAKSSSQGPDRERKNAESKLLEVPTQTAHLNLATPTKTPPSTKRMHGNKSLDSHQPEEFRSPSPIPRCTPRKKPSNLAEPSPASKPQTPQKRHLEPLSEEETGSSPIYDRSIIHSSTPVVLTTRKLRHTKNAVSQDAAAVSELVEREKTSSAKRFRRTIFTDETQQGAVTAAAAESEDESTSQAVSNESKRSSRYQPSESSERTEAPTVLPHPPCKQVDGSSCSKTTAKSGGTDRSLRTPSADSPANPTEQEATKPSFRMQLVRCDKAASPRTSTKKVKLSRSWLLLSNNSMSRLLQSDPDVSPFKGFEGNEGLPSDMTFEYASEVEVTDDEEREWFITEEQRSDPGEEEQSGVGNESLQEFIPAFSSPGKKSDSSWDDACDLYLSQSVQKRLRTAQQCPRSARKLSAPLGRKKRKRPTSQGAQGDADSQAVKKRRLKLNKNKNSGGKIAWHPAQSSTNSPTKRFRRERGQTRMGKGEEALGKHREDIIRVDEEVLFNYASPQKEKQAFSPLRVLNINVVGGVPPSPQQSPRTRSGAARMSKLPPPFKLD